RLLPTTFPVGFKMIDDKLSRFFGAGMWHAPASRATPRLALACLIGFLMVGSWAAAQEAESDQPEVELQRESVKVEPYSGPPIYLPGVGDPIVPQPIETRVVIDFHPKEDGSRPEAVS